MMDRVGHRQLVAVRTPWGSHREESGWIWAEMGQCKQGEGVGWGCRGHGLSWDPADGTRVWGLLGEHHMQGPSRGAALAWSRAPLSGSTFQAGWGPREPAPLPRLPWAQPPSRTEDVPCWAPIMLAGARAQRGEGTRVPCTAFLCPVANGTHTSSPTDGRSAAWSQWPGATPGPTQHFHRQLLGYLRTLCPGPWPSGKRAHEGHPPSLHQAPQEARAALWVQRPVSSFLTGPALCVGRASRQDLS